MVNRQAGRRGKVDIFYCPVCRIRQVSTGHIKILAPDTSPASHQMGRGKTPMAADNGDNWANKEEEHPCLSVFIRVLAKASGSEIKMQFRDQFNPPRCTFDKERESG